MKLNLGTKNNTFIILPVAITAVAVNELAIALQNGIQIAHLHSNTQSWPVFTAQLAAPYFIAALSALFVTAILNPKNAGETRLIIFYAAAWTYLARIIMTTIATATTIKIDGISYWLIVLLTALAATISIKWLICNWKLSTPKKLFLLTAITITLAITLPFFDYYILRLHNAALQ